MSLTDYFCFYVSAQYFVNHITRSDTKQIMYQLNNLSNRRINWSEVPKIQRFNRPKTKIYITEVVIFFGEINTLKSIVKTASL